MVGEERGTIVYCRELGEDRNFAVSSMEDIYCSKKDKCSECCLIKDKG